MATTKWNIDMLHSQVQFKVIHLMISTVSGHFENCNLEVETEDDDFTKIKALLFTADTASINTNNENRDAHLRSADFFYSEKYKHIIITGSHYEGNGKTGKLFCMLTIRETTKPVEISLDYTGLALDHAGVRRAGFSVTGSISRREFGLTWNAITEAGSVVVGDEVLFLGEIQLMKVASYVESMELQD